MNEIDKTIQLAKQQLPDAFKVGGDLPYSEGGFPRAVSPEMEEMPTNNSILVDEATIPTGEEDTGDFKDTFQELGFEAIAFYVSFHRPTAQGLWGIFYFDHRMRQFAELVSQQLGLAPRLAASLAFSIVRAHERFHSRFDLYALYHELILQRPLYNNYFEFVYRVVYCTADCFEEALANRSCLGLRFIPAGGTWIAKKSVKAFLERLFAGAPPGYRDYGKPVHDLRSGLVGQLLETRPMARLPEPQAAGISLARTYWSWRKNCPEFLLSNKLDSAGKSLEFKMRRGGHIWQVHKNDQDHWPSDPHAHDYGRNKKLDIRDGTIYDVKTRKPVGRENKKMVVELRERIMRQFPDKPLQPLAV